MNQRHRDIFERCPYGLSRLASLDGDTLEYVTGKELIGLFLLAKQHGRLSEFKYIFSLCPVTNVVLEDVSDCSRPCATLDLTGMPLRDLLNDKHIAINANSTETPIRMSNRSEPHSPFTDPSPSPPPHTTRERFLGNKTRYSYWRLIIAGLKLPVLVIGYFRPETTTRKICCYGGTLNGERCFLTSWE
jgi:hypothetical protein